MDEDDETTDRSAWRAWKGWVACLLGSVTPTAMLTAVVEMIDGKTAPVFAPALFVGIFMIAVLLMRPWTFR